MSEVDVGPVDVIARREPRLEAEDGRGGLGQDDALGLDAQAPARPERVDAGVGVARVDEDLLVLFEPRIESRPGEADGVIEALHFGGREHGGRAGSVDVADAHPVAPGVTPRRLHGLSLVNERVGRHVGQRNVVLGVRRVLPYVAGVGRVDDRSAGQEGPDAARDRLARGSPGRVGQGSRSRQWPPVGAAPNERDPNGVAATVDRSRNPSLDQNQAGPDRNQATIR